MPGAEVSELDVVSKLHALSGDVANQPYIARRGILPMLRKFLTNSNLEVQTMAAKTLRLLASHPDNPEFMVAESGLLATAVKVHSSTPHAGLKEELTGVLSHLKSAAPQAADGEAEAASGAAEGQDGAYPLVPEQHRKTVAPRSKMDRTKVVRRRMVLRCPNITSQNVDGLEYLLQNIRGMISYSIDTRAKTINLFVSTPKHLLLKHLADVNFESEVIEEAQVKPKEGGRSAGGNAPAYLSSGTPATSDYKKSLVVTGEARDVGGGLASRLKEHKERAKANQEANSSVAGFFSGLARNLLQ